MAYRATDFAYGQLASGITASATSLTLIAGEGARFPALAVGDVTYCVLFNTSGVTEIIGVTEILGDTMTIVRGQGLPATTAVAWNAGDNIQLRPTAQALTAFAARQDLTSMAVSTTLTTAQSGTIVAFTGAAAVTATLPAPSPGLRYKFLGNLYANAITGGTFVKLDGTTATTYTMAASGGAEVEVECDGTNWRIQDAAVTTTATNLAGGAAGAISYQTAPGVSAMLAAGVGVLVAGVTPSYTTTPTLTGTNFSGIPNTALTGFGASSGIATLDSTGKLTPAQIPASLVGALVYQGVWNASTNTPAITSSVGTKGNYYKVSVAGATLIDGNSQWNIGDTIVFDGATWDKIDGIANEVISIAGTASQITASASSGVITLSLPATINVNTSGNAATATSAGSATTATTATNLAGGLANELVMQSAAGTTTFLAAPTVANTSPVFNGTSIGWASVSGGGGLLAYLTYDTRGTLRTTAGTNGAQAVVDGIGLFIFSTSSTAADDDETAFVASGGVWLLEGASWDAAFAYWLPDYWSNVERIEDLENGVTVPPNVTTLQTNVTTLQTFQAKFLESTFSMTITSLASLATQTFTDTVTGANLGDTVIVTPGNFIGPYVVFSAWVSAANTVTIELYNPSATAATLTASTWAVRVINQ